MDNVLFRLLKEQSLCSNGISCQELIDNGYALDNDQQFYLKSGESLTIKQDIPLKRYQLAIPTLIKNAARTEQQQRVSFLLGQKISFHNADDMTVSIDGYYASHFKRLTFYIYGLDLRAKSFASEYLLNHITFEDGDRVIDCGTNSGDLRLALDHFGAQNIHYTAFEPGTTEFECFTKSTARF